MRGCRNLNALSFVCCDWSACVLSESWGELSVPPAKVIARGTQGVFEFVRATFRVGFRIRDQVFSMECEHYDLSHRNLTDGELLPLLQSFKDGKLTWSKRMILVNLFCVQYDQIAAGCDSSAAGWKSNRRQRRRDDRRGAEAQQQPVGT